MLRTSLRTRPPGNNRQHHIFLSSNAQDFIEEEKRRLLDVASCQFLSSNAQDFIEETCIYHGGAVSPIIPEQ